MIFPLEVVAQVSGPAFDAGTLLSLLVAGGLISALAETIRWFFGGRGKAKVDNAKIVQGMALDLLSPLHDELDKAHERLTDLSSELEHVLGWAIIAHALLEANHIPAPSPPPSVIRR